MTGKAKGGLGRGLEMANLFTHENRIRQAAITKEIIEVVSGAAAA